MVLTLCADELLSVEEWITATVASEPGMDRAVVWVWTISSAAARRASEREGNGVVPVCAGAPVRVKVCQDIAVGASVSVVARSRKTERREKGDAEMGTGTGRKDSF